jgi:cytochrome c
MNKKLNHILDVTILTMFFASLSIFCNQKGKKANMDNGTRIYRDKCSACHGYDKSNSNYDPALFEMIKLDKAKLNRSLNKALSDSIHTTEMRLTDDEQRDVIQFINQYNGTIP